MEFVAGEGHGVEALGGDVYGDFADGLGGVAVVGDVFLFAELGDLVDGEKDAGLVVGPEGGDQGGVFG